MNAVFWSDSGEAVSFGTTVATPLPDGMDVRALSAWEWDAIRLGGGMWDADSRQVVLYDGWSVADGGLRFPAPFPSWTWDGVGWQPPVEQTDPATVWDEASLSWVVAEDVL